MDEWQARGSWYQSAWAVGRMRISLSVIRRGRAIAKAMTSAMSGAVMAVSL